MIARLTAIALFCAGLFCIAQAQVPMTGAGVGAPGGGGTTPVTWTQTDSNNGLTPGSTIVWSNPQIGTANANRVVVFFWSGGTTVVSTVTANSGAITFTLKVREASTISGLDIWYASAPTGTTFTDITITAAGSMSEPAAVVGSLITTTAAPNSSNSSASASNSVALSLTVPTNGVGLWWGGSLASVPVPSWTTITQDANFLVGTRGFVESHYTVAGTTNSTFSDTLATNVHTVGATWQP